MQGFMRETAEIRDVFARVPAIVAALCAMTDDGPLAMVVSTFTVGVSWTPPLVSVAIQNSSQTWPVLRRAPRIGVSILGEEHASQTAQLASRRVENRLSSISHRSTAAGAIFLDASPTWLECSIEHEYAAGDHTIVALRVHGARETGVTKTLVWSKGTGTGVE